MVTFPQQPKVSLYGRREGSRIYVLLEDYHYGDGKVIPKGFLTDGVSVCRLLWRWVHPKGGLFPAAIIHDFGYYEQSHSRKTNDLLMRDHCKVLGSNRLKRNVIYYTLRLLGRSAWEDNAKRPITDFWSGVSKK